MTFRLPITDTRRFSSDPDVAESVVLPFAWAEKEFVRGFGPITRRPSGAVEPWSHESAFADLGRTLLFDNVSVEEFNREFEDLMIHKVRKRAWMALPDSTALFDIDVALQVASRSNRWNAYPSHGQFSLAMVSRSVARAAALPVRVGSGNSLSPPVPLLTAGSLLASRFASKTSAAHSPAGQTVFAGRTTVVVESPGLSPSDLSSIRSEHFSIDGVHLASFDVPIHGGGAVRCHVLWDESGNKGNRKRIRELRIHILRLHSIYELMRQLASRAITAPTALISDTVGTPGFDALQRTLLSCVRTVQSRQRPGGADSGTILDTAFFARNFSDRNLDLLLDRTISAMRPKVRTEVDAFRAAEEQRRRDNAAAESERNRQHAVTINIGEFNLSKYEINGGIIGAVGDNPRVSESSIGAAASIVTVGEERLSRGALLADLETIRQNWSNPEQAGSLDALAAVEAAEDNLRDGRDGAAIKNLRKAGSWALEAATSIGTKVASAAIAAAVGLP